MNKINTNKVLSLFLNIATKAVRKTKPGSSVLNLLVPATFIFSLAFSACSKDEYATEEATSTKTLFLKIGKASSKAIEQPLEDGSSTNSFTTGYMYFGNRAGAVLKRYIIHADPTTDLEAGVINLEDIQNGITIDNAPAGLSDIFIFGNLEHLSPPGSISEAKNKPVSLSLQRPNMYRSSYGASGLTHIADNRYTCHISIRPLIAIIELPDMTATGSVITQFTLSGIYVDNYYQTQTAGGIVSDLVSHGQNASVFNPFNEQYPTSLHGVIFDYFSIGGLISKNNIIKPSDNKVWSYYLFATFTGNISIPRLVIKLENIQTSDGSVYPAPQFITVRGFRDIETGQALKNFKAGYVYNIRPGALKFDETNLSPVPNAKLLDVDVSVSLSEWEDIDINPVPF